MAFARYRVSWTISIAVLRALALVATIVMPIVVVAASPASAQVIGIPQTIGPAATFVEGVACPKPTTCVGVGYHGEGPDIGLQVYNVITDGVPGTPVMAGGVNQILDAVACPTTAKCLAVGT